MWNFLAQFLIALVLNVISILLSPKPQKSKPEESREVEVPTSYAGRPIVKVMGTMWVKSPNVLGWWDKARREYSIEA